MGQSKNPMKNQVNKYAIRLIDEWVKVLYFFLLLKFSVESMDKKKMSRTVLMIKNDGEVGF